MITVPDPILSPFYPSTNGDLPDDLLPRCHAHLKALDQTIIEIEEKVSRLRAELDSAEERLQRLSDERAKCNSLLAPIRRVPIEILSNIILQFFDCPRILNRTDVRNIRNIQLVCKQWREATYVTCELWGNLNFTADRNNINGDLPLGDILEGWFKRAGINARLRLLLNVFQRQSDLQSLSTFFLKSRSFVELDLWGDRELFEVISGFTSGGSATSGGDFPRWNNVQYLALKSYELPAPPVSLSPSALPRMTYLHILGNKLVPFSHAGLQTLHIQGDQLALECSTLVSILSQLPSLKRLTVQGAFSRHQPEYTQSDLEKLAKVTVSHLRLYGGRPPSMAEYFLFPCLREVEMSFLTAGLSDERVRDICQFLRSMPSLESLFIPNASSHQLTEIVSQTVSLKRLHILGIDFFYCLSGPLPASLKEVVISSYRFQLEDFNSVLDYFTHHGDRQAQLGGRVRLYTKDRWPEGITDVQECLSALGVDVVGERWEDDNWKYSPVC